MEDYVNEKDTPSLARYLHGFLRYKVRLIAPTPTTTTTTTTIMNAMGHPRLVPSIPVPSDIEISQDIVRSPGLLSISDLARELSYFLSLSLISSCLFLGLIASPSKPIIFLFPPQPPSPPPSPYCSSCTHTTVPRLLTAQIPTRPHEKGPD